MDAKPIIPLENLPQRVRSLSVPPLTFSSHLVTPLAKIMSPHSINVSGADSFVATTLDCVIPPILGAVHRDSVHVSKV